MLKDISKYRHTSLSLQTVGKGGVGGQKGVTVILSSHMHYLQGQIEKMLALNDPLIS